MAIWTAIRPGSSETRILVTLPGGSTLLKARLSSRPAHSRAVPTLLEALALWEGTQVRAVLSVGESAGGHGWELARELFAVTEPTPLFELKIVDRIHRPRERIEGLGDFRDLRQLLLFEVAR